MSELARMAGVDISTVSRALSDSPRVKPETKKYILEVAASTGYVINTSARSLRRQTSEAIGLVIPLRPESGQTISDPFFLEMIAAVGNAASDAGYDLIVNMPKEKEKIAEKRLLEAGRADGLIVIGQAGLSARLHDLGPLKDRVVVWGGKTEEDEYTLVGSDNREGGRLAAEHLLSLGRRRILFVGNMELPEVLLRYSGLQDAYRVMGLRHPSELVLGLDFGAQNAFEKSLEFIDSGKQFDAIFAASDVLAIAALHAVNARGMSVPQDVAIVGYDNISHSTMVVPHLTTIDQSIKQGGEIMVDLLLRKLAGEEVHSQVTPTRLVVRQSTVAAG
ncbi:LacI family DNA-binding transcriptional regulator [Pseudokordiimonas caeni]|uniref:LacI family DNA-binding transcriptional regulator n=1 Tax=Pseudokordiimonas caeni TaxID=2997908 RepID=UPI0028121224|nr:substrate-binding domain-containing protein [Pseudokordiimonas caeni]